MATVRKAKTPNSNEHDSPWILKVGTGGLVPTINVLVHIDQWDEPQRVNTSYKLEGDPVEGGGLNIASRKGPRATEAMLQLRVARTGPMARMWEAMSKPQLAKSFAGQLKTGVEKTADALLSQNAVTVAPSLFSAIGKWLRNFWWVLFGASKP